MEQRVIQIGNSVGVVLPQDIRQSLGLRRGDKVVLNKKGDDIIISRTKKSLEGGVNDRFMKIVDEFIDEHEDVLQELARR